MRRNVVTRCMRMPTQCMHKAATRNNRFTNSMGMVLDSERVSLNVNECVVDGAR
jgi:hypothetical protein